MRRGCVYPCTRLWWPECHSNICKSHRILLSVRMRIHCGIGRFCLSFLASVFLVRRDLLAGCGGAGMWARSDGEEEMGLCGGKRSETHHGEGRRGLDKDPLGAECCKRSLTDRSEEI